MLLRFNLKQEYSKICDFVRVSMSLAIVRSNSLTLRGPQYNEVRIHKKQELTYGSVMVLLMPWRG